MPHAGAAAESPASTQTAAQQARNLLGAATKTGDPAQIEDARRNLHAAVLEQHIRAAVDSAPPLTAAQREKLALLLRTGGTPPDAS